MGKTYDSGRGSCLNNGRKRLFFVLFFVMFLFVFSFSFQFFLFVIFWLRICTRFALSRLAKTGKPLEPLLMNFVLHLYINSKSTAVPRCLNSNPHKFERCSSPRSMGEGHIISCVKNGKLFCLCFLSSSILLFCSFSFFFLFPSCHN